MGNVTKQASTRFSIVTSYNRKNLERELQSESRQQNRQQVKIKRREEEI